MKKLKKVAMQSMPSKHESAEGRMHKMEKAMHGKNTGKGFKGYGNSKSCK